MSNSKSEKSCARTLSIAASRKRSRLKTGMRMLTAGIGTPHHTARPSAPHTIVPRTRRADYDLRDAPPEHLRILHRHPRPGFPRFHLYAVQLEHRSL